MLYIFFCQWGRLLLQINNLKWTLSSERLRTSGICHMLQVSMLAFSDIYTVLFYVQYNGSDVSMWLTASASSMAVKYCCLITANCFSVKWLINKLTSSISLDVFSLTDMAGVAGRMSLLCLLGLITLTNGKLTSSCCCFGVAFTSWHNILLILCFHSKYESWNPQYALSCVWGHPHR